MVSGSSLADNLLDRGGVPIPAGGVPLLPPLSGRMHLTRSIDRTELSSKSSRSMDRPPGSGGIRSKCDSREELLGTPALKPFSMEASRISESSASKRKYQFSSFERSRSISSLNILSTNHDLLENSLASILESSQSITRTVRESVMSRFSGPLGLPPFPLPVDLDIAPDSVRFSHALKYLHGYTWYNLIQQCISGDENLTQQDTVMVRKALFQEHIGKDLDRTTKELLDGAERLSWTDGMSTASIERWLDAVEAAERILHAVRLRNGGS